MNVSLHTCSSLHLVDFIYLREQAIVIPLLLLATLLGASTSSSQNEQDFKWHVQKNSPPSVSIYNDIQMVNATTGYAVGYNPQVMKTTDGGKNWRALVTPESNFFYSVYFVNPLVGTAVGDDGAIIRTTDGGETWNLQANPAFAHFRG